MHSSRRLKLTALLLLLCFVWSICGAPLTAEEWRSLPAAMIRVARQLPYRMHSIWRCWPLMSSAQASVPDGSLRLAVWNTASAQAMMLPIETYVAGVVAAEMPAAYEIAALQCQAVAARTRAAWACRALGGSGCRSHPGNDLCTDSACCQGYLSPGEAAARWDGAADAYQARIWQAVSATAGQVLTWDSLPIETLYHACSGGRTEDATAVFAHAQPYLVSVDSPGEESYAGFLEDTRMSRTEAARRLTDAFPDCGVTADGIPGALRLQSSTASGRIGSLLVGSVVVTGNQFRQALGLRSALCTWDADGDDIIFHTRGYGHGVGMSQAGTQAMAADGADCATILAHYYPGTALCRIGLLLNGG